jgi:O-antigen ligase
MLDVAYGGVRRRPLTDRLQMGLGLLTLGVVLVSVLPFGGVLPVAWTLLALVVFALFLAQLAIDLVLDPPGEAARRVVGPAMLYGVAVLWALVQIWPGALSHWADPAWSRVPEAAPRISADPVHGAHVLMRLTAYAMIFWIILRTAERPGRATVLIVGVAVFSTILAALGIYWAWIGRNPILGDLSSARVTATFVNRNSYATYALLGLVVNSALYIDRTSRVVPSAAGPGQRLRDFLEAFFRGSWVFALGAVLCLAAVLFTESRAGSISAVLALAALAVAHAVSRRSRNLWVMLSFAALVVFAGVFLATGVATRIAWTAPDEMRFEVYALLIQAIAERPLSGYGIGAFEDSFRAHLSANQAQLEWDLAHNSYLENLFELGVIGATALYAALLWIAVVVTRGVLKRRRNRVFPCAAFACLVGAGFHALSDFSLQMPATAALFAAILALGWSQSFSSQEARTA